MFPVKGQVSSPDNLLAIFVIPLAQSELFQLFCFGGNWAQRQYASFALRPGCAVWSCESNPMSSDRSSSLLPFLDSSSQNPPSPHLIGSCLTCPQCKGSMTRPVTMLEHYENSVPSRKARPESEGRLSAWHLIMLPLPQGSSGYRSAGWPC